MVRGDQQRDGFFAEDASVQPHGQQSVTSRRGSTDWKSYSNRNVFWPYPDEAKTWLDNLTLPSRFPALRNHVILNAPHPNAKQFTVIVVGNFRGLLLLDFTPLLMNELNFGFLYEVFWIIENLTIMLLRINFLFHAYARQAASYELFIWKRLLLTANSPSSSYTPSSKPDSSCSDSVLCIFALSNVQNVVPLLCAVRNCSYFVICFCNHVFYSGACARVLSAPVAAAKSACRPRSVCAAYPGFCRLQCACVSRTVC